jgi:hypothetical protein
MMMRHLHDDAPGPGADIREFVSGGYSNKIPARLVIVFHGWGGDEREFMGDRTVMDESNALKLEEDRYWFSIADSNIGFWARAIAAERRMKVEVS